MEPARTLPEYRSELDALLDDPVAPLTEVETTTMREIVRQRRNGRRDQELAHAAPHIRGRADDIVALLTAAARELRPRETQQLDDLVAGRMPSQDPTPRLPVRPRGRGWPAR